MSWFSCLSTPLLTLGAVCAVVSRSQVDSREVTAGLLFLAQGSKSDKLSLAFSLFDSSGERALTRRGVWKYIRAFLTFLVAQSSACATMESDAVQQIADVGAVDLTADIFLHSTRAVRWCSCGAAVPHVMRAVTRVVTRVVTRAACCDCAEP